MTEPPIIQAEPVTEGRAALGRIGLFISLAPLAALAAMWLSKPG